MTKDILSEQGLASFVVFVNQLWPDALLPRDFLWFLHRHFEALHEKNIFLNAQAY
jgi:hypothetical protein